MWKWQALCQADVVRKFDSRSEHSVAKVDDSLGIVYGFAIVCKVKGQDYYDTQGDHIPEDVMAEGALEFMQKYGDAKIMHRGKVVGKVVFAMPYTTELAQGLSKSHGGPAWPTEVTGLLIGWRPDDKALLGKFRDGEFTGFSIGGFVPDGYSEEVAS